MASLLREFIRKSSYVRLLTTSTHQNPPFLAPPPSLLSTQFSQSKSNVSDLNPQSVKGLRPAEEPNLHSLSQIYPSFSLGYFLNPNISPGLDRFEPVNDVPETDDSGVMRADSVKRKRKKKMNKHKLRKRRKLLSRKT